MKNRHIVSPMASGSGAYVVHRLLEHHLPEYRLAGYHPYWTFFPFLLPATVSMRGASLIHTTPDYAPFFFKKTVPLIITFHNYVLDRWMKPYSTLVQKIHYATDLRLSTRLSLRQAHRITAVSQFTADLVKRDLKISRPIRVIYNGINIDHFTPVRSSGSSRQEVRVFFSGNLTRRKGAHWLPSIAKSLQKNVRIFYTQGLRTRNIWPVMTGLQPLGPVRFEEMPARYHEMDILLMPTVREGFSLAILEAMASGLPVVASNCSSLPEQVDENQGGFLCPVGDVKAFAEKINLLADSPKLRREMGEYNRAKIEKQFTIERMIKEYRRLFEEALSPHFS